MADSIDPQADSTDPPEAATRTETDPSPLAVSPAGTTPTPAAAQTRLPLTVAPSLVRQDPSRGHNSLLLILALLFVGAIVAMAASHYGVCPQGPDSPCAPGDTPDLSKVLLPFVAIATAIERFWETIFNWYEGVALRTAKLIGITAESTDWIKQEYKASEDAVSHLVGTLSQQAPGTKEYDEAYTLFQKAESRLQDAQSRITEGLKSPAYTTIKQAITVIGSLLIGLFISLSSRLYLFHKAGFSIPGMADLLLTGLLIGAGPGPLHQVIGLLQGLRDSVGSLASVAQGTAVKKAVEAVGQAEAAATGKGSAPTTAAAPTPPPTATATGGGATTADEFAPPPPVTTLPVQRQAQRLLISRRP